MLGRLRRRRELKRMVASVPFWWHSIDLGDGVVTPGRKSPDVHLAELAAMRWPDLRGKSVLDIGGWDGFYAFEAERRGASRVAVLDHYMWAMDVPGQQAYWRHCAEIGEVPAPYHTTEYWHPDELPGKRGFDVARTALRSSVEAIAVDFMDVDLASVGQWDVTLYLGVLYHMEDPIRALKRLASVTGELSVIETETVVVPGLEDQAMWRFFPTNEVNADISNWWAPNLTALRGAAKAAGFRAVETVSGPPPQLLSEGGGPYHYRAVVHALK